MVVPAAARSRISSQNSRRASGSKPVVGSSRKSSSGRPTMPSATSSRRFCPPERVCVRALALSVSPTRPITAVRVVRRRVERGEVVHHLAHGQLVELAGALQHDADPGPPVLAGRVRVDAEHADLAAVAPPVALQDLHRGGLAGAVRSEQGEHLAAFVPSGRDRRRRRASPYDFRNPRTEIASWSLMPTTMRAGIRLRGVGGRVPASSGVGADRRSDPEAGSPCGVPFPFAFPATPQRPGQQEREADQEEQHQHRQDDRDAATSRRW